MPTTVIELPRSIEVKDLKIDKNTNTITIQHRVLAGMSTMAVAYLTCQGENGMESQAVITLSGNTGQYRASNIKSEGVARFDLSPEEFSKSKKDDKKPVEPAAVTATAEPEPEPVATPAEE